MQQSNKKRNMFPHRELNPGRPGESQESQPQDYLEL